MTFDWLEFLSLGESLMISGKEEEPVNESKLRAAIGRMYYAVFGRVRQHYVDVERVSFSYGYEDHDILKREIENRKSPRVAMVFHRLRKKRNDADYDDEFPGNLISTAESQLTNAREVLSRHGLLTPQ